MVRDIYWGSSYVLDLNLFCFSILSFFYFEFLLFLVFCFAFFYSGFFSNLSESELMQYRRPVGLGPSGKR